MAIFAISDLHLSLGVDKPMSVFGDKWENYTDKMLQNWNNVVGDDDLVVIPGDISWATYLDDAVADFEYIHSLNGKKLILKGNHDYWWTTPTKMNSFLKEHRLDSIEILQNKAYMYGKTAICGTRGWQYPSTSGPSEDRKIFEREKQRLILSLEDALSKHPENIIVAMHYPPVGTSPCENDFLEIMNHYKASLCVFGHLHASSYKMAPIGEFSGICLKLVACDYLDFIPKLINAQMG